MQMWTEGLGSPLQVTTALVSAFVYLLTQKTPSPKPSPILSSQSDDVDQDPNQQVWQQLRFCRFPIPLS